MLDEQLLDLQPDDTHRAIWRWLDEHAARYPPGLDVPPLKPPAGPGRAHRWGALELVTREVPGEDCPQVVTVDVAAGAEPFTVGPLPATGGGAVLAASLFSRPLRGTCYVLGRGGRWDLHVLFKRFYREWLALGYSVAPVVAGSDVKLMTVRRDKHAWHFVDWHGLTGLDPAGVSSQCVAFGGAAAVHAPRAVALRLAAEGYASWVLEAFGVHARLTLGQTAVAAASRTLPDDSWLWRPNRVALALCREGGGFRGGYCYYPAYRGPGHKIDIRRAYTWALGQPLPCGSARGPCAVDGRERQGVYVCEVRGPCRMPVYLSVWQPGGGGFVRRLWSGDRCHAVLPAAEFAGLRALGCVVRPGWGAVDLRSFTFRGFVDAAAGAMEPGRPDATRAAAGKLLVNAVYGKLAERPERDGLIFSAVPPTARHLPYTDSRGDEIEGAWCDPRTDYRHHQHVDVAATVTAHVRSRLYQALSDLLAAGHRVLAVDTDGLVTAADPGGALDLTGDQPGDWRYVGYDPDMTIAAPRFATWQNRAISAGTSRQPPEVVQLAHARGIVAVEGKVMAPPWQDGAIARTVRKRLRRGA